MPVADELAALRALGTVKTTSATISSKAPSQTFTTPQQQEVLRKQKAKQEKKAREQAAENLRKHNAGGINDLWYKKLRELKARKRAGYVAWKKKDGTNAAEGEEGDGQEEEDMGLEVGMLPDHLVKALKAKYETENAEEALSKALKEEEEGRGSILSEVMADLDEENVNEECDEVMVAQEVDVEQKPEEEGTTIEEASNDNVQDTDEPVTKIEDSQYSSEIQSEQPTASDEIAETEPVTTEDSLKLVDEEPTDEEPVEQVRTKIEQLSIEDAQSFEEKKESDGASDDAKESEAEASIGEMESTETSEQLDEATIDDANRMVQQTDTRLFYNVHTKQLFTDTQNTSEDAIDVSDADQRAKLEDEQNAQLKEQLVALQDQIKDLLAGF